MMVAKKLPRLRFTSHRARDTNSRRRSRVKVFRPYCAVRKIGDRSPGTAQSGGESEEGRRSAPLGRVRGEG